MLTGRPGMLQFMGSQRVRHNWATELNWSEICISKSLCCKWLHLLLSLLDGRNGHPLQYSCQEKSMDRRTWWAIVHGVAKNGMWLSMHKHLSGVQNWKTCFFGHSYSWEKYRKNLIPAPELHCHKDQDRASQVVLVVKNLPTNAGDVRDVGSVPGSGRFPWGGNDNPLQYSSLGNPVDRGAWQATVHRVAKSWTWLKWLSMHAKIKIRPKVLFESSHETNCEESASSLVKCRNC